ncbi:MAG: diiron oxygenase [Burkholderiales bacterium]
MSNPDHALLEQLSENSRRYRDPVAAIDWSRLDNGSFWLPEPALSLYGLPEYEVLAPDVRRRLSQYEFIHVMHAGLWLERVFMQRVSRRLAPQLPAAAYEYFLHEMREEAGHSLMFLRAIKCSGLEVPADSWRAPWFIDWMARKAPATGALFWAATVIAEDVADKFNRYLKGSADINPAVREICTVHCIDEARHIAAARVQLETALLRLPAFSVRALNPLVRLLFRQYAGLYYTPPQRFYELAGLTHGEVWRSMALRNPERRAFVRDRLAPTARMLETCGFRLQ